MDTTARRQEFAPPPTPGMLRALVLAILAHGVLLAILSAGMHWKREAVQATVEAELWSSIPVQAAPPAPEPEPQPEPPKPEPKPEPKVEPVPTPAEIKAQADIAIAKEKKEKERQLKEKKLALEQDKLAKQKAELEKKDKEKQDKLKKEQADKQAKAKEEEQRKQEEKDKRQTEEERKAAVKRALGLAGTGGSGPANSSGVAAQSSGRSANYMGKIAGAIKANITYLDRDSVVGDPRVEVDITFGPSGTILSARIVKSSGLRSWDEAVMRAIDKTTSIPKDTDGTVPSMLPMAFRVKD